MKVSRQMRIVIGAIAGLAILGLGAKMFLLKGSPAVNLAVPPAVHHPPRTTGHGHRALTIKLDPDLPAALRVALLHHGVVVAVVYAEHSPGDGPVVSAARSAAQGAHVGFAALDVGNEAVATAVALKLPGSSDPSVAVVKRPGQVMTLLPGYVDSQVVAQAVRDAGR
jgi:hypothetical protein